MSGDEREVEGGEGYLGVVVLGTGRSGTSAIARALISAGFFAGGDEELLGPAPSNPLGHFEPLSVLELNETLLERFGCSWWCDAPAREDQIPYRPEVAPSLRAVLDSLVAAADGAPVAIKEPRINGLLPLWLPVIDGALHPVLTVRDPLEIAMSHAHRDGTSTGHSLAAWEEQMTLVLDLLDGRSVTVAPYGEMIDRPMLVEKVVADATSRLDPKRAERVRPAAATAALRPDLRNEGQDSLSQDDYLTVRQAALWSYLGGLPPGRVTLEAPAYLRRSSEAALGSMRKESEKVHLFRTKENLAAELIELKSRLD